MENCANCKYGETCNKDTEHIHCVIHDVSLTKTSKCAKWEWRYGKEKV